MVRDEIQIIEPWLDHALSLFDQVLVADHRSTDGTLEVLLDRERGSDRLTVYRYIEREFRKEQVISLLRSEAVRLGRFDWLFFLDPDEFLPFRDKQEFTDVLDSADGEDFLHFRWRNCYPDPSASEGVSSFGFRQVRPSKVGKLAISRMAAEDPDILVPIGAHSVTHRVEGPRMGKEVGEIYHFPARSPEQAWRKTLVGTLNRLTVLQAESSSPIHWHYPEALRKLARGDEPDILPLIVHDYGEVKPVSPSGTGDWVRSEFESCSFAFAGLPADESPKPLDDRQGVPGNAAPMSLAQAMNDSVCLELSRRIVAMNDTSGVVPVGDLELTLDRTIRQRANFDERAFAKLPDEAAPGLTMEAVVSAVQASFWDVRHPVASAWSEHVPFLFSLFALLKPRCYVELGVHRGASFLSACQAVASLELETTCVAVDNWVGDAHAGYHDATVFREFTEDLKQYQGFAGYIRAEFSKAVGNFDDGSIDLLHIDGFHSASAVRRDYETWKRKLSRRGVILFHDVNEYRMDFGVWRFWRELRDEFPYIEFGHGHGLGVLVVGEDSPLRTDAPDLPAPASSPMIRDLLQVFFGSVGQLSLQMSNYRASQNDLEAKLSLAREEAAQLSHRVHALERSVEAYRESLSWKLTAPLRGLRTAIRRPG
ncbi:hypothetical protein Rumeso_01581 [Rubellimicrobium mesophilum DSM 19309]|uniref:Uncharacterized protein n=2 Tax=Rubellimicrobium TaxID=295418 RepID=A0A017HR55_9RHOB|nr:hypothetical protein Rumeso_01581 [Rubellimicrobium mesophilum DSM 19309]